MIRHENSDRNSTGVKSIQKIIDGRIKSSIVFVGEYALKIEMSGTTHGMI